MTAKRRIMYACYYAPGVVAAVRVLLTLWFLISDPFGLPLRFFQVILLLAYSVTLFSYFKLYSDGVPVISLIAPTLVHAVVVFVFRRIIAVVPFAILLVLDILFLIIKSVKANMYPFDVDGEEDDSDLLFSEGFPVSAE